VDELTVNCAFQVRGSYDGPLLTPRVAISTTIPMMDMMDGLMDAERKGAWRSNCATVAQYRVFKLPSESGRSRVISKGA
jgi:hypothetical protein